jgi:hypothetical protein
MMRKPAGLDKGVMAMQITLKIQWSNKACAGVPRCEDFDQNSGMGTIPKRAISCLTAYLFRIEYPQWNVKIIALTLRNRKGQTHNSSPSRKSNHNCCSNRSTCCNTENLGLVSKQRCKNLSVKRIPSGRKRWSYPAH